jgi:hypothetical protein
MEREDVVHVLRRFREALVTGGVMLDLQVVPPDPVVEVDGAVVCSIDGSVLLDAAVAATIVVDETIARGLLREEGVDDHDVLRHYPSGGSLVEHFETSKRSVPPDAIPLLTAIERPCIVREHCRLRRLRTTGARN